MSEEIWKDIDGFPNYQVSDLGRVRNKKTGRILKPGCAGGGYLYVVLSKDGVQCNRHIHRLVAESFLDWPSEKRDVNHIDGNKQNNYLHNLEWCTRRENINHAYANGLNKRARPVRIVETGEIFNNMQDCANAIGAHKSAIRASMTDKRPNCHSCRDLHFEYASREEYNAQRKDKRKPFLRDYQMDAVNRLRNGCVLLGDVGSGKSRTGIYYFFKENGGWIDENGYVPMKNPQDLYIITTAKKRNSLEWWGELANFHITNHPEDCRYKMKVVVDSWNNIGKYADISGAFFLFDEQRVVGTGAWTKAFLKIAKKNNWILLSATPGDTYSDYLPLFLANGFFKNKTEFNREHVIFSRFTKYPMIERYIGTHRLDRLKEQILVHMDYSREVIKHKEDVYCSYDVSKYKDVMKRRWDIYKDEPITQASGLCYVLRRVVNSDESRQTKLLEILEDHPRVIIFYNFNYELDILRNLYYGDDVEIAEYNGQKHDPVPTSEKWVYLTQYSSACEGWNCITTNAIVFFSQNYSYKMMHQASGRIDRMNSPYKELFYYYLKSRSGIDLAISKALNEKRQFNERRWVKW